MSSRAPGWTRAPFDSFSSENQSNNESESPRLNWNAYKVYKPYVCSGLDYERLHHLPKHDIRLEAFRASLITTPFYLFIVFAILGPSIKQPYYSFCSFFAFLVLKYRMHQT